MPGPDPGLDLALSREITRIISCPYPASLNTLNRLVLRADTRTVTKAIRDRPSCAVSKLAELVTTALPLWAYAIPLLRSLCRSPEFIDRLLQHHPALLDALLTKANASEHDFDEYAEVCVQLLSRPLPEVTPLPGSAQSFFLRVFDKAIKAPDVAMLQPIYYMLNGACKGLLDLLTPQLRFQFDQELCRILSSNSAGQNSMLLLWCIGIVLLAEHPESAEHDASSSTPVAPEVSSPLFEKQWLTASGQKLFGSAKGLEKTINLITLSVIWASKGDVGVSDVDAAEGIRIANRVMHLVNLKTRQRWLQSSPLAKTALHKLPSKILRGDIDLAVQLESMTFYAMISAGVALPPSIVTQFESTLLSIATIKVDGYSLREALFKALPLFASQMRDTFFQKMLCEIIRVAVSSSVSPELSGYFVLVEQMTATSMQCSHLRTCILRATSISETRDALQSFIRTSLDQSTSRTNDVTCETFTARLCRDYVAAITAMFLTAALTVQPTEPALPPSISLALLNKQRELVRPTSRCTHSAVAHPKIALFEEQDTPGTGLNRQDWRDRLKSELERANHYQKESVVRSVAQICHDLESRCENVEEPLRIEQEKARELGLQVSQLTENVQSLTNEAMDRRLYIDGLEAEISNVEIERDEVSSRLNGLEVRIEDMEIERDALSSRLEELQLELVTANKCADETLRGAQEAFNTTESNLRSIISTYEQDLHGRDGKIEKLYAELSKLEHEMGKKDEEQSTMNDTCTNLQIKLRAVEKDLHAEQATTSEQSKELKQLKSVIFDLETRLRSMDDELKVSGERMEELQRHHELLLHSSRDAAREMELKHESEMKESTDRATEQLAQLNSELQDALYNEQQAKDAYEDAQRDLQIIQAAVITLESKVQQLNDTCSEKDEELDELRSLRSRILASMGLGSEDSRTSRERLRRKSVAPAQSAPSKSSQGITNTAIEDVANASFTSSEGSARNGSTPKRAKSRTSFKIPNMHASNSSNPRLSSRSISKKLSPMKRPALKPVSPNRRHTTVGFAFIDHEGKNDKNSKRGKRRGSLCSIEEQSSFDTDGLLEGTPFTPCNFITGTGRQPDDDEGTTEF